MPSNRILTRIYPITLIAALVVIPLLFYNGMMRPFQASKALFLQVMVFLLICIRLIQSKFSVRWNLLDLLVLVRFVAVILFYFISNNYHNLFFHIDILFYLTVFYFLIQLSTKDDMKILINWGFVFLFFISLLEAVYGIFQFYSIDIFHTEGYSYFESKVIGTFGNANAVCGFLAVGFPLILFVFINQKKKLLKWLCGACCGVILWTIGLTMSRGGWIALLAGTFVFGFPLIRKFWHKLSSRLIFRSAILAILCLFLVLSLWGAFSINPDSATGRLFIWKVSFQMIKDFPFLGIGYGNYSTEYLNYQARFFDDPGNQIYYDRASNIKQAHNEIIHVTAETGLLGLSFFLLIIISFYGLIFSLLKSADRETKWQLRALAASGTAVLTHSFFDSPLYFLPISLIFYFIIGLVSYKAKETGNVSEKSIIKFIRQRVIGLKQGIHLALVIISVILLFYNIYSVFQETRGYMLWKEGQDAVSAGNWKKGIDLYERAIEYLPDKAELQFHLGAAYAYTGHHSRERFEKAIELLKQSLSDFNDKNIYLCLGSAYRYQGRHHEAEESFRRVLRMYPKLLLPRVWLAQMFYQNEKKEDAIAELKIVLDTNLKVLSEEAKNIKKEAAVLLELYLSDEL